MARDFLESLSSKHLLICGLGLTGMALVRWCCQNKIRFSIFDENLSLTRQSDLETIFLKTEYRPQSIFGDKTELNGSKLGVTDVILSPGIPRKSTFLETVRNSTSLKIPIWNDVDFFYPLFQHFKIIAVTGTDGKSTTVHLIEHLLKKQSENGNFGLVLSGGNNGIPIASILDQLIVHKRGVLILEFSSYMLEEVHRFRSNISTVLNLAPDHLDRYDSLEDYFKSKYNLVCHNRADDIFLVNTENANTAQITKYLPIQPNFELIHLSKNDFPSDQVKSVLTHPMNVVTALSTVKLLSGDLEMAYRDLKNFSPLAHRLERVTPMDHPFQIFNDSKATTLQSVISAITSFHQPVKVILGGRNKNISFASLKNYRELIKGIYFYGEAGEEIKASSEMDGFYHYDFKTVVTEAYQSLEADDRLLLSPGCSSFDQFKNFEERGQVFKSLIADLIEN